jgi:hypothetical protein
MWITARATSAQRDRSSVYRVDMRIVPDRGMSMRFYSAHTTNFLTANQSMDAACAGASSLLPLSRDYGR